MAKSKQPQVNIPEYQKPSPTNFNTPWGSATYGNNAWNFSLSPDEQMTMNTAQKVRQDLLSSLGLQDSSGQDPYTKAYMNNLLSLTQPKTENALIGRGLGGSSVYQNAITDLITKAANESILSGKQSRLNNLTALQNVISPMQTLGQNLLNIGSSQYNTDQQLAQSLYNTTLPYKATVTQPFDYSSLLQLIAPIASIATAPATSGASLAMLPGTNMSQSVWKSSLPTSNLSSGAYGFNW